MAHDFESQLSKPSVTSKVFASNLGHLAVVFLWLGGMHFHGAYLSNYSSWLISPKTTLPSAHIVWPIVGQDLVNMDLGSYYSGKVITSGLYQLWLSEGILNQLNLKLASSAGLIGSSICSLPYKLLNQLPCT